MVSVIALPVPAAQRAGNARPSPIMKWRKRQCAASRTSGQRQAAREAGPVIRIAIAKKASVFMRRLLAEAAANEKTLSSVRNGKSVAWWQPEIAAGSPKGSAQTAKG